MSIYTLNQFDKTNHSLSVAFDAEYNPIYVTEEHLNDIGEIIEQFGEHNIMYGQPVSEETRAKISAANKGRKHTEETRAKVGVAFRGKKHTDETRDKMKGRVVSEETRAKVSAVHKGKIISEETRANMRAYWQARRLT